METCLNAFNQALYATIKTTMINTSGAVITAETQFAWRCFTNDLSTGDILGAYETKRTSKTFPTKTHPIGSSEFVGMATVSRHSARAEGRSSASTSKRSGGGRERSSNEKNRLGTLSHTNSISDVLGSVDD